LKKWNSLIIAILYLSLYACTSTSQSDEKPHLVAYCDLVENPEQYHEQVVRVRARHVVGFEWSYLTDDNCSNNSSEFANETWIIIPSDPTLCEGAKQTSASIPRGDSLEREVTIVGTFHNSKGGHMGYYPFYIELICLERAGKWQVVR
jgi:hypothetical protein